MKLSEFIAFLAADLKQWTEAQKGQFHVARDPLHPYVILAGGTYPSFVVVLSYVGGSALGAEEHPHGMQEARVELFLGKGMDLRADPGAWLYKAEEGQPEPLLGLLSDLRARALTIAFDNGEKRDSAYAQYGGEEPATLPNGVVLRGWKLTLSWPISIEIDPRGYVTVNE